MRAQTHKQTGIRLSENLILQLKGKARKNGLSFNAYVEEILQKEVRDEIPFIDPAADVHPNLLAMAGTIRMPSREEIKSDPRLAAALGL